MKVKVEGIKELRKALRKYAEDLGDAFKLGCENVAETFISHTDIIDLVKYDSGALRASAIWFQDKDGFQTETIIGYGAKITQAFFRPGRSTPQEPHKYAYYQHDEMPSALYPGTQWMWMDDGLDMFAPRIVGIIIEEMSRV
jgi:hypothetical protein